MDDSLWCLNSLSKFYSCLETTGSGKCTDITIIVTTAATRCRVMDVLPFTLVIELLERQLMEGPWSERAFSLPPRDISGNPSLSSSLHASLTAKLLVDS